MSEVCCGGGSCDVERSGAAAEPLTPSRIIRDPRVLPLVIAGLFMAVGGAGAWLGRPLWSQVAFAASAALSLPVPARRAWASIGRRALDINVLMIIAVVGAAALGEWMEAAAVVWLFGVAQWFEALSMDRTRHAIRSLLALSPTRATIRRGGSELTVAADAVVPGDLVIVRPGERIPVDATVLAGESLVDESPVTGESWPAERVPGHAVFAGAINGTGALELLATRAASDSTLARIVRLVEAAQKQRAPVQGLVDRFARRYTPAVVAIAVAVAFAMPLFTGGLEGWTQEFAVWSYRALALLVVACPCALVISTPVSIVSALTAAARHGVLIKGGAHLEQLGQIRSIAFDKTGTLTDGRVRVTDVRAVEGSSATGVLAIAASLEARSEHPIGRAIVDRARGDGLSFEPGAAFRALPGLGAEALVSASSALVGSHRLFHTRELCTPTLHQHVDDVEQGGATPVLVAHGGSALGVLGVSHTVRVGGEEAIAELRRLGIARIVALTGDTAENAEAARMAAGLDEAHGNLLPEDKVRHLERLRLTHGPVAMVGDGINDAPALAAADVGIAMAAAGSDVAIETADVALMTDDLSKLPYAVRLGRATLSTIRLNVSIAVGLKIAFVALAAAGLATLWMAILADTGASLLVTATSLRLLRVR